MARVRDAHREGAVHGRHTGPRSARPQHPVVSMARHRQRGKSDATKIEGKLDDMVRKSVERYPPKKK